MEISFLQNVNVFKYFFEKTFGKKENVQSYDDLPIDGNKKQD
jgi:hypothetical protein